MSGKSKIKKGSQAQPEQVEAVVETQPKPAPKKTKGK